jgi:hypothetical protein
LNLALGAERFRRQLFRDLRIELWQKPRIYPRHHLTWDEGQTEVDVVLTWENPPTTVFIEMKYGSNLSAKTVNNNGSAGYPADKLIRKPCPRTKRDGRFNDVSALMMAVILSPPTVQPKNPAMPAYGVNQFIKV